MLLFAAKLLIFTSSSYD